MTRALTHSVSTKINDCQLTHIERRPIDVRRAEQQHLNYRRTLAELGVEVVHLEATVDNPDNVFIEDVAVVVEEIAVMANLGAETRRGEVASVERELSKYRKTAHIQAPATLDGGDVLQLGRHIFVGQSGRTNGAGLNALGRILRPYGYRVIPVELGPVLHLKTGCTSLNRETILVNREWVDTAPFVARGIRVVAVPRQEGWAANVIRVNEHVLVHKGNPVTAGKVEKHGYDVGVVDIGEFGKAEGSLTCLSILFENGS